MSRDYIELFQGRAVMQLFWCFRLCAAGGISRLGCGGDALTLLQRYRAEIWRGCVDSIATGRGSSAPGANP